MNTAIKLSIKYKRINDTVQQLRRNQGTADCHKQMFMYDSELKNGWLLINIIAFKWVKNIR